MTSGTHVPAYFRRRLSSFGGMIDGRDFLKVRKLADTQELVRPGPRVAFAGGADGNDHYRVWRALY